VSERLGDVLADGDVDAELETDGDFDADGLCDADSETDGDVEALALSDADREEDGLRLELGLTLALALTEAEIEGLWLANPSGFVTSFSRRPSIFVVSSVSGKDPSLESPTQTKSTLRTTPSVFQV